MKLIRQRSQFTSVFLVILMVWLAAPHQSVLAAMIETEAVLLLTTSDAVTAEILVEALKENDIPCLMRSGAGTYSGIISITPSMKGISIYVPEPALDEAIEIAETIIPDFELPDEAD